MFSVNTPYCTRIHVNFVKILVCLIALFIACFSKVLAQPGSLDVSFGGGDGKVAYSSALAAAWPSDIALQSDGKLVSVIGPGPNSTISLIRINTDGSLDTSFNGTGVLSFQWGLTYKNNLYPGHAWAVGIQNIAGSERIIVAGQDPKLVGKSVQNYVRIDRFMPDGTTDTSFGTNGTVSLFDGVAYDTVIRPDQKIVGVTQGSNKVFRLNANGTLDTTFGSGGLVAGNGTLQRLALDIDGSILVTSTVMSGNGRNANQNIEVRKYKPTNGSLDSAFGTNGSAIFARSNVAFVPKSITVDMNHNILIGTRAWTPDQDFAAVRFTQNGLVDTSFAANGLYLAGYSSIDSRVSAALMEGDGKIVLIGNSYNSGGGPKDAVVIRLNYNGSVDTGFGTAGVSIFDISGDDSVSLGPGGVIQVDPFCACERILVASGTTFVTTFARLNTL